MSQKTKEILEAVGRVGDTTVTKKDVLRPIQQESLLRSWRIPREVEGTI